MTLPRAIASELVKLRTTRTFLGLVIAAVLLSVGIAALAAALGTFESGATVPPGEDLASTAGFAGLFAVVLGLLAVTTEFRHGTITPALLAVPSRTRLIAAKVAAHLVAGFALGVAVVVLNVAVVELILALRDIDSGTGVGEALGWVLGFGVAAGLGAGLGVGLGAVVRNQVGAIVGVFAWILVVEPLLTIPQALQDPIERFGLGGILDGADGVGSTASGEVLGQLPATLLLAAYAVLAALAGAALLRRRDVTA